MTKNLGLLIYVFKFFTYISFQVKHKKNDVTEMEYHRLYPLARNSYWSKFGKSSIVEIRYRLVSKLPKPLEFTAFEV